MPTILKYVVCGKKHVSLMCEAVESRKHESKKAEEKEALDIEDLRKLGSIGIKDPIEKLSKKEPEDLTKEHFLQTVKYNDDKRYEVHLPWLDNWTIRRLESTTKKLIHENLYDGYEGIFLEWLHEGISVEVPVDEINLSRNYLPHRLVLKESSTTPIRPVFDASARMKGHPSLNESLNSGPNLIELIPDTLLRFREKKIGGYFSVSRAQMSPKFSGILHYLAIFRLRPAKMSPIVNQTLG
ncbi:hypothetical protein AVEN_183203-1 [Araneus ventricosus]|uniref:Uncharacterized protein n=1 Tax=Araneus ventricosus TaxID=182803 RepID=A0A4Y2PYX1_ARAVE|nr:hypothetical protein AVEN_183203-1 [Araneus ventricosus]